MEENELENFHQVGALLVTECGDVIDEIFPGHGMRK
jgi:hypothetical protein